MIAYLIGTTKLILQKSIILNVNGVGYEVFCSNDILSIAVIDENLEVFIHTSVKEDSITLYGFRNKNELKFFKQLISVSGIGPKTALEILNHPLEITTQAIFTEDSSLLSKIPGLGKKTAERLILELKGKIEIEMTNGREHKLANMNNRELKEAIDALETLGYKRFEIMKEMKNIENHVSDTEDIIKWFLARV